MFVGFVCFFDNSTIYKYNLGFGTSRTEFLKREGGLWDFRQVNPIWWVKFNL